MVKCPQAFRINAVIICQQDIHFTIPGFRVLPAVAFQDAYTLHLYLDFFNNYWLYAWGVHPFRRFPEGDNGPKERTGGVARERD
jgi:hypothetical protein